MSLNPGIYLKIITYGIITWMIIAIMNMLVKSAGDNSRNTKAKITNTDNVNASKTEGLSTKGEPLNLVLMILFLLVTIAFIEVKVGFELVGGPQDYPAIALAAIPIIMLVLLILFNIIEYTRGIKKVRRWGLKSETNDLSERKKKIIDIQRKSFHLLAMALLYMALVVTLDKFESNLGDPTYALHYQNFWGAKDGLGYLDHLLVHESMPMGQVILIFWMYGQTLVLLTFEITRLSNKVHFLLHREIQATLRYKEIDTFAAFTHFSVGYLFAAIVLPPLLFFGSMCLITFADPAASSIGMRWGKHKLGWGKKSWEGLFAGTFAAFISMVWFVGPIYAAVGAIGFAIVDMATPNPIKASDNIVMPLIAVLSFSFLSVLGIPCSNLLGF